MAEDAALSGRLRRNTLCCARHAEIEDQAVSRSPRIFDAELLDRQDIDTTGIHEAPISDFVRIQFRDRASLRMPQRDDYSIALRQILEDLRPGLIAGKESEPR